MTYETGEKNSMQKNIVSDKLLIKSFPWETKPRPTEIHQEKYSTESSPLLHAAELNAMQKLPSQ